MLQGTLFPNRVLTGPPGSGKTTSILRLFQNAWRDRRKMLLVVPTVSFREHTRNTLLRLAPPSAILDGRAVVTFDDLMASPPPFPEIRRELLVRRILEEHSLPLFQDVRQFPGFRATLAAEAEELLASGLSVSEAKRQLRSSHARTRAFLDFAGFYEQATASLRRPPGVTTATDLLLVDGFTDFTHEQKQALRELANKATETHVTLPESSVRARDWLVNEMGFMEERMSGNHRGTPEPNAVACHDRAEEVALVADGIADLVRVHGYHYREIGVIVQRPDAYLQPLADLCRARSIPVRLFFPTQAAETSMGRHLLACLRLFDADAEQTAMLDVLKSAWYRKHDRGTIARLDFRLAEGKPPGDVAGEFFATVNRLKRASTASMTDLNKAAWVIDVWESLTSFDELLAADHIRAIELRADAQVWRRARELPAEIAAAIRLERASVDLREFVHLVERELRALRFRVRDRRSDAVNVMNAYEARQWELRAVFVIGLVEGEFPAPSRPGLFLSQAERLALRLSSAEEVQQEQRYLYEVATTRARERLTLTWSASGGRGNELVPSRFVAGIPLSGTELPFRPPLPSARSGNFAPQPTVLRAPYVLARLRDTKVEFDASGLKDFAQCPFKHFARHLLHLRGRPMQERGLQANLTGTIVHETIARWEREGGDIAAIFEHVYQERTAGISMGHGEEKLRARMRADLIRFVELEPRIARNYQTKLDMRYIEHDFRIPMELPGDRLVTIKGRMDRVETVPVAEGELGLAVDFKYSNKGFQKVKMLKEVQAGNEYQIPVYLLALRQLGLKPGGMELYNLRGNPKRAGVLDESLLDDILAGDNPGVSEPLDELMDIGRQQIVAHAASIRTGEIVVRPTDNSRCKKSEYGCEYFDVCRYAR